ncbi:thiol:disulfide interchange protein DsbA/DsbL [Shewanella sp. A3A]|nr:thiol:disulfide interchange protein DsbA/DsbL [Shewanella ferrihydritica]
MLLKRFITTTLSLLLLSAAFTQVQAAAFSQSQAGEYQAGIDYQEVSGFPEVEGPVVREFFSYNCPHCYNQDPQMNATAELLKGKVAFERTPVGAGRKDWIMSQKAYYIAKTFKVVNQVHREIFSRIHEQHLPFQRDEDLLSFFEQQGVAREDVEKVLSSADLKLALSNYDSQTQLSGISGVPSLLVNGKYLIVNKPKDAQGLAKFIVYLTELP